MSQVRDKEGRHALQKKPQGKVHEQCYLTELSTLMDMFYTHALQYGSHQPPALDMGLLPLGNLEFFVHLFYLFYFILN